MTNARLFAVARADDTIIITPQRDLTEFEFADLETEGAEILGQVSKSPASGIVVDFSKITWCGSSALGFFTRLYRNARLRGGEMAFCGVSPEEREVLRITRLDTLWPVYETLDEALAGSSERRSVRHDRTWIVVADRALARVFEQSEGADEPLTEVTSLVHPESRLRYSQLVTDSQGYFRGGGGGVAQVAGEPAEDHRHHTAREFAGEVATYLDAARQRGRFQSLVLMAAPLFLGSLRDSLSPSLRKLVRQEVAHDYTHLDSSQIREHVLALEVAAR